MNRSLFLGGILPVAILFCVLFHAVIFEERQFCTRDTSDFYYPLFNQIQREWNNGHLPLWDPYENLGQPLAANPTSAVFYPGKILFFCTALFGVECYDYCFKWYILLHYIIAFWGMFRLLRFWQRSEVASLLGALAFIMGGTVFYQYANLIFLIGSAWLPWGILIGISLIKRPSRVIMIKLGVILALMILGGDPQTAYLLGVFLIAYLFWGERDETSNLVLEKKKWSSIYGPAILGLMGAAVMGALFSAVQLIPGREMAALCDRFAEKAPISIWQLPSMLLNSDEGGTTKIGDNILCRQMDCDGHAAAIYHFSLAPWRILEFFAPNIGGDYSSGSGRWFSLLPNDDNLWSPTLYMGILPFLLALSAFHWSIRSPVRPDYIPRRLIRFMSWLVLLSLLAAFGGFGLVWMIKNGSLLLQGGTVTGIGNGDPIGGLYWFMNLVLPGFSMFRYPAKIMMFCTFALAVLAAIGWDCFLFERRLRRWTWGIWIASISASIFLGFFGTQLFTFLDPENKFLVPDFAVYHAILSLIHVFIVVSIFLFMFYYHWNCPSQNQLSQNRLSKKSKKKGTEVRGEKKYLRETFVFSVIILSLTCCDLYFAHWGLVYTVPSDFYSREPLVVKTLQEEFPDHVYPIRLFRMPVWNPLSFLSDTNRMTNSSAWDRKTLAPKYGNSYNIGIVNSHGTMTDGAYAHYLKSLEASTANSEIRGEPNIWTEFELAGIEAFLLPYRDLKNEPVLFSRMVSLDCRTPCQYSLNDNIDGFLANCQEEWPVNILLWKNESIPARVIIHRNNGMVADSEYVKIIQYESNRLRMKGHLESEARIILREQYVPGWKAIVQGEDGSVHSIPVHKESGFLRAMELPAGSFELEMVYIPRSFYFGLGISLLTCLFVGGYFWKSRRACLSRSL